MGKCADFSFSGYLIMKISVHVFLLYILVTHILTSAE